jgi:hypothetical protein
MFETASCRWRIFRQIPESAVRFVSGYDFSHTERANKHSALATVVETVKTIEALEAKSQEPKAKSQEAVDPHRVVDPI